MTGVSGELAPEKVSKQPGRSGKYQLTEEGVLALAEALGVEVSFESWAKAWPRVIWLARAHPRSDGGYRVTLGIRRPAEGGLPYAFEQVTTDVPGSWVEMSHDEQARNMQGFMDMLPLRGRLTGCGNRLCPTCGGKGEGPRPVIGRPRTITYGKGAFG